MSERFYHDDQTTRQVFDARGVPSLNIQENEVFYIGYQVSIGNAMWYHHAILLADCAANLLNGSALLSEQICTSLRFDARVTPVFARSLLAQDADVIDSAYRADISQEIDNHLSIKQSGSFLVFGLVGDSKITLIKIEEEDAMTAIASACKATHDQAGDVFSPIDVCQAHHVTAEFSARYDLAVHRIKALLNCAHISAAH